MVECGAIIHAMAQPRTKPRSAAVPPNDKIADRLRAHAQLCRQIARATWSETTAIELTRLADQCVEAADNIEPAVPARLH